MDDFSNDVDDLLPFLNDFRGYLNDFSRHARTGLSGFPE
jgi:hypothetical protein